MQELGTSNPRRARRCARAHSRPAFAAWWFGVVLLMCLPFAFGQEEVDVPQSSTTSTSSSSSSATTTRPVATSSIPAKTVSAWVGAPTINITNPNSNHTLEPLNKTHPVVVVQFPQNVSSLAVTFNIVSLSTNQSDIPRVLVGINEPNRTYKLNRMGDDSASGGSGGAGWNKRNRDHDTWEVVWDQGFANWTYALDIDTGDVDQEREIRPSFVIGRGINETLQVSNASISDGNVVVYINFAEDYVKGKVPGIAPASPLLGDSTATSVLVFSTILYDDPLEQPTYPNYTLPGAELVRPSWDPIWAAGDYNDTSYFGVSPNLTVALVPTSQSPVDTGLGSSLMAILDAATAAANTSAVEYRAADTVWTRLENVEGFRSYFVLDNLQPSTNYTMWMLDEETMTISRPAFFTTKDADFNCPLMLPTNMCPGVGYASPIADSGQSPLFDIPQAYADVISANLQSFETSLLANGLACGRDKYSFVSTCLDCYTAYRDWLCRIVLPQCAPSHPPDFTDATQHAPQAPMAVPRSLGAPRNPEPFPAYAFDYQELKPCIGVCTAVERKCPVSLGFICPHRHFNANESYAFLGGDSDVNDGTRSTGWPALDTWGNRWCNG